jgi:leucyl/phenylalanyl-tRNA--protein transferase
MSATWPVILSEHRQFDETWAAWLRRWTLGLVYPLRRTRIEILPRVLMSTFSFILLGKRNRVCAGNEKMLHGPQGFAGISEDMSVNALVSAYRNGLFPFCHLGPMKWWSPETRAVLDPQNAHVSKKIRQLLRSGKYAVTFDQDFAGVIKACAEVRPGKTPLTWITPRVMSAYHDLHLAGYAHSVEVWDKEGKLIGGAYGVAAGEVFFGESQFSRADHASKIAIAVLHEHLAKWGFKLRDAKFMTGHLESLGFHTLTRAEFMSELAVHAHKPDRRGKWQVEATVTAKPTASAPARSQRQAA